MKFGFWSESLKLVRMLQSLLAKWQLHVSLLYLMPTVGAINNWEESPRGHISISKKCFINNALDGRQDPVLWNMGLYG